MAVEILPRLLSLFAFAGMALSANATQGSYVDVLTSFLRQAQSQAGSLLCEPARLEALLRIKIDAPGRAEIWRKTHIVAWDGKVLAIDTNVAVSGGQYWRFRSDTTSFCQLNIQLNPGQLCEVDSPSFHKAARIPYWVRWTPPHGPNGLNQQYQLFDVPEFSEKAEIWVTSSTNEQCAKSISVKIPGRWLTEDTERSASVQDAD